MPIDPGNMPQPAITAVEQLIRQQVARATFVTSNLRNVKASALARSFPHRVEYLSLKQILDCNNLKDMTRPAGWRLLLHEGEKVIAAARVRERGNEYILSELSEGALVTGTEAAVRFAERIDSVQSRHFEAVLLMAPEVCVAALWLMALEGGDDIVITIPTLPDSEDMEEMSQSTFIEKLKGLAGGIAADRTAGGAEPNAP